MFILKTGHQPGVYVPLRALFLVICDFSKITNVFINEYENKIRSFAYRTTEKGHLAAEI